jgi:hypothetical protein
MKTLCYHFKSIPHHQIVKLLGNGIVALFLTNKASEKAIASSPLANKWQYKPKTPEYLEDSSLGLLLLYSLPHQFPLG